MGIVFRQSAKTSIVVLIGSVLGALIIWLSTKYIEDKHQFGFVQNLTNNAVTAAQILLFGLNSTLTVFIQRYIDDSRKRKMLLTICFAVPAVMSLIAIAFYYLLRHWVIAHFQPEDIQYVNRYYDLLPVYILLFIYQMLFEQYLGSQMKVAAAAFVREVLLRILTIFLLMLYGFQYIGFPVFVVSMVLIYIVPVLIFFILSLKTKAYGFSIDTGSFTRAEYKEIIHFSWYHFLLTMALILMYSMDALLIPFYDKNGFGSLAIYRVAVFFISFLQLPSKALIPASLTVLSRAFAEKDIAKAKDIFIRSSINIFIPSVAMAMIICCSLPNAVAVIKNGYGEIVPVFLILMIGVLSNIATGMNDQVLSIANYYKFNFYVSLILIVVLFLSLKFLVPVYGIYGAAWCTTATLMIFNVAKFLFVWKKLDMQPFTKNTLLVVIAALPALAAGYFFPYFFEPGRHVYVHSFIDAILRSTAILGVYFVMLLWLKPSPDLEEYLASIRKNKRLF